MQLYDKALTNECKNLWYGYERAKVRLVNQGLPEILSLVTIHLILFPFLSRASKCQCYLLL